MAQSQTEKSASTADQSGKAGSTTKPAAPESEPTTNAENDPIAMLSADHRKVEQLFGAFEKATDGQQKSQLAEQICSELSVHTLIEEEIFYPACHGHMEERVLEEAQVEHDGAKALIIEIMFAAPEDQYFAAKVKVLSEDIKHHVREEEMPGSGIFAKAKEGGVATPELAKRMADRKQQLMEEARAGVLGPPETRSFRVQTHAGMKRTSQEDRMSRSSSSTLDRDERGRFVSDDDDRDYRRRTSSRSRYQDDDRRMPPRDEEGRFTNSRSHRDDDDDRRSSRSRYADDDRRSMPARDDEGRFTSSRSRRDDDDDRRGGRSYGGWYGDPEGHSEASRRGWEERGGSRYRDDDDDGRSYSRSRMSDDDRRGPRDHGGWYGDPGGHSEASRRGWEERSGSRGRYRDDDDDDRRGSRGHGGWYGDPEGHSEAARRGRR